MVNCGLFSPWQLRQSCFWLAIGYAAVFCTGCSDKRPPTYPAQVNVAFADGSPLRGGRIEFQSIEVTDSKGRAISATGIVGADGSVTDLSTFSVADGIVAGKHRVAVAPARRKAEGGSLFENTIDRKYLGFDTSGLQIQVNPAGERKFTIHVSSSRK